MNKEILRKIMKERREGITNREEKTAMIRKYVRESEEYKNNQIIAIYLSKENEVDTWKLVEECLKDGKTVCIPRVYKEGRKMVFYEVKDLLGLEKNDYNVYEPQPSILTAVFSTTPKLNIIPVLGFDSMGNRLGSGGGYYDRYFAHTNDYKLGIAFKEQETEFIETNDTDIRLDSIITEEGETKFYKEEKGLQNIKTLL